MAVVKPFKGLRPPRNIVEEIASRPYDVLNSSEARNEANGNEKSLYRIIKPEIDFENVTDEHHSSVYERAAQNFKAFQEKGWLVQDPKEYFYIYAQTMNGATQYGLVVCCHIDDYVSGKIKKHELTRKDKEEDRIKHVRINDANIEPVFFAYPDNKELDLIVAKTISLPAEYDFVSKDQVGHRFWIVDNKEDIECITKQFASIPYLYIADGHHRTAAAASVGIEKARENSNHRGDEEYNYFMAVCFPSDQLNIMAYNRLVKDLNRLTISEFLEKLKENFDIEEKGTEIVEPIGLHNFSIYVDGKCYSLTAHDDTYDDNDAIKILDVSIVSKYILDQILAIKDLRTDNRIDFVGGIRGLNELKQRVDSGEMKLAIALHPVTMKQIINIADSGNIMPPKTTWFEPKLRSGLVIHKLS